MEQSVIHPDADAGTQHRDNEGADAAGGMDADEAAARVDEGVHLREVDVPGFHDAEVRADVEAPDVTSDSLGTGLEAILARRSA